MKKLGIIGLVSLLSLTPLEINSQNNFNIVQEQKQQEINFLIEHFREKGFEIENLFNHPNFEFYPKIDNSFKISPERKAQLEKMSEEEKYESYKNKIGLKGKKQRIGKFIEENIEQLVIAEKEYNIPKEVIAATLGIESDFGRNIGKYYAFNAYVSLYLKEYKKDFALKQLEELLKYCKKNEKEVFELKSSYAGAIGYCQFLPYSLNNYFIGENVYDMDDNILSIGNYLNYFKKKTGSLEKAIFRYNPSGYYVKAVLDLSKF